MKKLSHILAGSSESVNESFFRMDKNVISDDLYLATKNLQNFYDRTAAGNDVDTGVIDTVIKALERAKKATKKFNSKEEVAGTVYESVNESYADDLSMGIVKLYKSIGLGSAKLHMPSHLIIGANQITKEDVKGSNFGILEALISRVELDVTLITSDTDLNLVKCRYALMFNNGESKGLDMTYSTEDLGKTWLDAKGHVVK